MSGRHRRPQRGVPPDGHASAASHDLTARDEVRGDEALAGKADRAIRLGCLRAAIELRSPGSALGDLLVTAAAFYEFVTGARDDAPSRDPSSN